MGSFGFFFVVVALGVTAEVWNLLWIACKRLDTSLIGLSSW